MSGERCVRCRCAVEETDLRCAVCGHATDEPREKAEGGSVTVLRCTGCASAMAYDPRHRAPACVYCGEVLELEEREDPPEEIDAHLPFTVSPARARAALEGWMEGLGWLHPGDLRSASQLEKLKPVWWVGWCFDASALVSWTADSDLGAKKADWAPCAGQEEMRFESLVIPASQGLTPEEAQEVAATCDLTTGAPEPEGPPEAATEIFSFRRSAGRERVAAAIEAESAGRVLREAVPGRRKRHLHTEVLLRDLATRRLAFPAYVMAYRYRGRLYRAVISGQDARAVRAAAPRSRIRVALVALAAGAAGAALLAGVVSRLLG